MKSTKDQEKCSKKMNPWKRHKPMGKALGARTCWYPNEWVTSADLTSSHATWDFALPVRFCRVYGYPKMQSRNHLFHHWGESTIGRPTKKWLSVCQLDQLFYTGKVFIPKRPWWYFVDTLPLSLIDKNTLPETNIAPEMDDWRTSLSELGARTIFRCYVSFREGTDTEVAGLQGLQ